MRASDCIEDQIAQNFLNCIDFVPEGDVLCALPNFFEVFKSILSSGKFSRAMFECCASHPRADVRESIAINPHCPPDLIGSLAADDDPKVRAAVALRPDCPEEILNRIANDSDGVVADSVLNNPKCPTRVFIDKNFDGSDSLLSNFPELEALVPTYEGIPYGLLYCYARSTYPEIRSGVAMNSKTPKILLLKFLDDPSDCVRSALARNPNCPPEAIRRLAEEAWHVFKDKLAQNPSCPSDVLEAHANDGDDFVRLMIASNPNCTRRALKILARDKSDAVRKAVAGNPNCPENVLVSLSRDADYLVRCYSLSNPNFPIKVLHGLAGEKHPNNGYYARRRLLEQKLSEYIPPRTLRLVDHRRNFMLFSFFFFFPKVQSLVSDPLSLDLLIIEEARRGAALALASNAETSNEVLDQILDLGYRSLPFLQLIARHPNASDSLRARVAESFLLLDS